MYLVSVNFIFNIFYFPYHENTLAKSGGNKITRKVYFYVASKGCLTKTKLCIGSIRLVKLSYFGNSQILRNNLILMGFPELSQLNLGCIYLQFPLIIPTLIPA